MAPHSPSLPAPGAHPSPPHLPWWALVLPAVAFSALLAMVASGGHPDPAGAAQPLAELAGHLRGLLPQAIANLLS